MQSLVRLFPYIWPQRGRVIGSFVLAGAVALMWAGALLLVFPVVKVLLENQDLRAYISEKRQAARVEVDRETERRDTIDAQLAVLRTAGDAELVARRENDRLHCVGALNDALRREWQYSWVEARLLPLLSPDRFNTLATLVAVLLIVTAIKCVLSYFQETLICAAVERIMQTLRERLFRATLKLDHQTLALETTPRQMSRFTYDVQQLAVGLIVVGSKAMIEPLKAVFCIACAFSLNWRLTTLSFICVPIAALLFAQLGGRLKRASRRQMESMSRVYRALIEPLQSFAVVQAFRNERLHRRKLAHENRNYYDKAMKIIRIDALSNPSVEFLAMLAVFIGSLPGAYMVLRGQTSIWGIRLAAYQMEPSELALLYTLLAGVLDPARRIASIFSKVKKARAAGDRVFAWMDRSSLLYAAPETAELPRHHQSIEFDRVTFRYAAADEGQELPPAIYDVSLTIPFGATVAVVGGNGSGKSTLANLLPRLFDPQDGTIRIDGVDISRTDPRKLRSQIGVVAQDTLLFDTTIEENIRYGLPSADLAAVTEAARRAQVLSFVHQMPDGLRTGVGDRGHRLSGGQRQRIALARAILRDPAILILDEATSAVDAQSEQMIHGALADLAKGRTTLIVTHTMTPMLLDQISHVLVIEQGRVLAFGPHDTVIKTCPAYQRMFEAQVKRRAA